MRPSLVIMYTDIKLCSVFVLLEITALINHFVSLRLLMISEMVTLLETQKKRPLTRDYS